MSGASRRGPNACFLLEFAVHLPAAVEICFLPEGMEALDFPTKRGMRTERKT